MPRKTYKAPKMPTTWEVIAERDLNPSTVSKFYTIANSKKTAEENIKRRIKSDYPETWHIVISDVKKSK